MGNRGRFAVATTLVVAILFSGCAIHPEIVGPNVARYQPGDGYTMATAPESGLYVVVKKVSGRQRPIEATKIRLAAGDALGFRRDLDGTPIAVALHSEFPLTDIRPDSTYLVWRRINTIEAEHRAKRHADAKDVAIFSVLATAAATLCLVLLYNSDENIDLFSSD